MFLKFVTTDFKICYLNFSKRNIFMFKLKPLQIVISITIVLLISLPAYPNSIPDKNKIMAKAARLQIPFIENQGQIKDKNVRFYANTFAGNV